MTETRELHITNIPRTDKGCWVAASRAANSDLATWVIDQLNEAAKNALDDVGEEYATALNQHGQNH